MPLGFSSSKQRRQVIQKGDEVLTGVVCAGLTMDAAVSAIPGNRHDANG
jgi:hypothetical protein